MVLKEKATSPTTPSFPFTFVLILGVLRNIPFERLLDISSWIRLQDMSSWIRLQDIVMD